MKKINRHGFTLIELLAVIVILGILMMVAIPAMTKYINNSRKDTYGDTAKAYINAVRYAYLNDELYEVDATSGTLTGELCTGLAKDLYIMIDTKDAATDPKKNITLESGGKSSWANRNLYGYVYVKYTAGTAEVRDATGKVTTAGVAEKRDYYIKLGDGSHLLPLTAEGAILRDSIVDGTDINTDPSAADKTAARTTNALTRCYISG